MYKNKVKFKGIRNCVRVSNRSFGSGCSREAFNCDYVKDGKKYIVKRAYRTRGMAINKFEFHIYRHAKHSRYEKFYPDFRAISKGGEWLLVEKCRIAIDEKKRTNGKDEDPHDIFPYFMLLDVHDSNWGYTLKNKRPVYLDLGYCSSRLSDAARSVGVPPAKIEEICNEYDNY